MKNRRGFLATLSAASGVAAVLPLTAQAALRDHPSTEALAFAAMCRTFDPALGEAELHAIARGIDENRRAAAALNPVANPLPNSAEMVARFAAAESV